MRMRAISPSGYLFVNTVIYRKGACPARGYSDMAGIPLVDLWQLRSGEAIREDELAHHFSRNIMMSKREFGRS